MMTEIWNQNVDDAFANGCLIDLGLVPSRKISTQFHEFLT
jgi:hypothetical protein